MLLLFYILVYYNDSRDMIDMKTQVRAFTYLKRNIFYSFSLVLLIFLLAILSLGSMTAIRVVGSTEDNLWSNLPTVVMVEEDYVAILNYWQENQVSPERLITREIIDKVAELPYVSEAHASIGFQLLSRDLEMYGSSDLLMDSISMRNVGVYHIERFNTIGVIASEFAELSTGVISLTSGFTFTELQLEEGAPVAIISQELADENGLTIGSNVNFERVIQAEGVSWAELYDDNNIEHYMRLEFEIIGIYQLDAILTEFIAIDGDLGGGEEVIQELNMLNTIFMPYETVARFLSFYDDLFYEYFGPEAFSSGFAIDNLFVINNARNVQAFQLAAEDILPEFITTRDVTDSFEDVLVAMNNINDVITFILLFIATAAIIILALVIVLFARIRRHEIGTYLALGARKRTIIQQIILELLLMMGTALILAIPTNHFVSSQISRALVYNEIKTIEVTGHTRNLQVGNSFIGRNEYLIDWFVPSVPEIEDFIEVFDVGLRINDIALFTVGAIAIMGLATATSMIYILLFEPKKILSYGERG